MRTVKIAAGAVHVCALVSLLVSLLAASVALQPTRTAHAAPTTLTTATAPAAATVTAPATARLIQKLTLPETSIAGPGYAVGSGIAWTGTDAAHHVNVRVRVGPGGLNFPEKTILPETSPFTPAIVPVPMEQIAPYALAWTGTDPNHSLNVQIPPAGAKLTLRNESSFAAPALASERRNNAPVLLLAWTGTDPNHSLNVLPLTVVGSHNLAPGTKTVLRQFSSDAGPSLVGDLSGLLAPAGGPSEFVLGWSVRGTQRLNLATSADGVHFTSALGSGLPQTSAAAPQFIRPGGNAAGCIAWMGTDAAHHLNVQCTAQFPQFPDPAHTKTVLDETALGAPGFSFAAVSSQGEIAWTGTDAAHHLNVAQLTLP